MNERCETCRFWERSTDDGWSREHWGTCRWRPPMTGNDWPYTKPGEWCGRYVGKGNPPATPSDYR